MSFKIGKNANEIRKQIIKNDGYCIRKPEQYGNNNYKCPCMEFINTGECACGMFTKEKIW